jgi:hypothetical protein
MSVAAALFIERVENFKVPHCVSRQGFLMALKLKAYYKPSATRNQPASRLFCHAEWQAAVQPGA